MKKWLKRNGVTLLLMVSMGAMIGHLWAKRSIVEKELAASKEDAAKWYKMYGEKRDESFRDYRQHQAHHGGAQMRYEVTVTDESGQKRTLDAMSWRMATWSDFDSGEGDRRWPVSAFPDNAYVFTVGPDEFDNEKVVVIGHAVTIHKYMKKLLPTHKCGWGKGGK